MLLGRTRLGDHLVYGEIEGDNFYPLTGDVFTDARRQGPVLSVANLEMCAPVSPSKILAIMGGFIKDVEFPRWVPKVVESVSGDGGEICVSPLITKELMMEGELAVVIGRQIRFASQDEAADAIFGYTCFDDATAFDLGKLHQYWGDAKSVATFASLGPLINTDLSLDDIRDGVELTARVNGEVVKTGNSRNFRFMPNEIISHISQFMTFFPGDVITLGTPGPVPVQVGDKIEIENDRIGMLRNTVVEI